MYRLATPLRRTSRALYFHHTTSTPRMSSPGLPRDWVIVETSPGGVDLTFANTKTREGTFYTPEGMTAEEILAIPDAKKYWSTVQEVQQYIKEKADEKMRFGGEDYPKPQK